MQRNPESPEKKAALEKEKQEKIAARIKKKEEQLAAVESIKQNRVIPVALNLPEESWEEWGERVGYFVTTRLIFPPLLIWDASSFVLNKLLGNLAGKIILQAQWYSEEEIAPWNKLVKDRTDKVMANPENFILNYDRFFIETEDGIKLDTLEVKYNGNDKNKSVNKDKVVINFIGNGQIFEQNFDDLNAQSEDLKCTVIGFNYRNVSLSAGSGPGSKQDLVTDGIYQVQRLLDNGVNPENIYLKGHSLGGGIGALVAKHFHKRGMKVDLYNGSSFSTLTNVVTGWTRRSFNSKHDMPSGHEESYIGIALSWIVKPVIKFVLALLKWEINAIDAYRELPETHKEHSWVRSPKKHKPEYADAGVVIKNRQQNGEDIIDDPVIPNYAALGEEYGEDIKKRIEKIEKQIKNLYKSKLFFTNKDKFQQKIVELENKKRDLHDHNNERKMVADPDNTEEGMEWNNTENKDEKYKPNRNGHCFDANDLKNRKGISQHNFFCNHVNKRHVEKVEEIVNPKRASRRYSVI